MVNRSGLLAFVLGIGVSTGVWYFSTRGSAPVTSPGASVDTVEIVRTMGGWLEVTTIRSPEVFTSTTSHTILGIPFGTTTTMVSARAHYTYRIPIAKEWKVTVRDKTVIVIAPPVQPSLPVAIDTASIRQFSSGSWSMITGPRLLSRLLAAMTQELERKAKSPSYINFQREKARQTVVEFIQKPPTQAQWKPPAEHQVKVFFADEPIQALQAARPPYVEPSQ